MSVQRNYLSNDLATLYSRYLAQASKKYGVRSVVVKRDRARNLGRLKSQGVTTVADLLDRLAGLSPSLKQFGIELIVLLKIRRAVPILLELMSDRAVRTMCAATLAWLNSGGKVTRFFIEIGHRELACPDPDRDWLEAVVHGLSSSDDRRAVEVLVAIFERTDLPGWLRGDAADKLGCCAFICDRRTLLFRRCRDAAFRGLEDESIYAQFGSMYLIGALCSHGIRRRRAQPNGCESALPKLRKIAANDHRLAPGYWWSMSAEAEDILCCVKQGRWPDADAGERWKGHTERGEWNRD